ncbi:hypothetical protein QAD02_007930 [Eretmocerus hayati]|uniref:Uncharacterized protein n=1 Tax=Eretmocerus hayati TaxID=131215 RepID=A0ACC2N5N1_9HYME|nr:hypothetical protein QAD02_007930 [Eretmocerus hayati]
MNSPKGKEAEYGKLTVKHLKDRLAAIGAKLGGRKKELIERLILYELNANFGHELVDDVPDERMKTPVETTYKDLHAGCPMPAFTRDSLLSFSKRYEKRIDEGQGMYTDGYLLLVRFAMPNDQECGLFVSKDYPFICGTPDRLLCYVNLLEVKCPYSSRHYMMKEVTVPYLGRDQDGYLRLEKKHPYYYQVQGQMLVTNRAYCDLVVWTFVDMHHETIERDPDFIQEMLKTLIDFYDKHLKPAILKKYLYRNTDNFCSCPGT